MKKTHLLSLLFFVAVAAFGQQRIPPFSAPYGNTDKGMMINNTWGAASSCRVSTGSGEQWGACPGGIAGVTPDGSNGINVAGSVHVAGTLYGTLSGAASGNVPFTGGTMSGLLRTLPVFNTLANLVAWGDSLTAGGQGSGPVNSYPASLQLLLGQQIANQGYSGYTSSEIAVISGAVATYASSGFTIPACTYALACTPVTVTFTTNPSQPYTGSFNYIYGTFSGVQGYVSYSGTAYQFTAIQTVGSPVNVASNTQFIPSTPYLASFNLINIGRNDVLTSGCSAVQANIAAMAAQASGGYMVGAIFNANTSNEWSGGANYTIVTNCNSALATTYGSSHWVKNGSSQDLREQLVQLGCARPSSDIISASDCAHDEIPTYLRAYYANAQLASSITSTATSVSIDVYTGSLTTEANEILTVDTGANAENMQIVSCTGSSNPYSCTVVRGYGGNQTSHGSGAAIVASSYLHLNSAGYSAEASIWFNSLVTSTSAAAGSFNLNDFRILTQNLHPAPASFTGLSSVQVANAFYANLYPNITTVWTQANDPYGSWQTPNNVICQYTFSCNLGEVSGGIPVPWHSLYVNQVAFANSTNNNLTYLISGTPASQLADFMPQYHSGTMVAADSEFSNGDWGFASNLVAKTNGGASLGDSGVWWNNIGLIGQHCFYNTTTVYKVCLYAPNNPTANDYLTLPTQSGTLAQAITGTSAAWNNSGSSIAANTCVNGPTATLSGLTTSMTITVTPAALPGLGLTWNHAYDYSGNTAATEVCNGTNSSITPTSTTYNFRAIQ